jgi:hypothetical protein
MYDVETLMNDMVNEISQLLDLDYDSALILLQNFRWAKEKLIDEYYSNSQKVMFDAGLAVHEIEDAATEAGLDTEPTDTTIDCQICYDYLSQISCWRRARLCHYIMSCP